MNQDFINTILKNKKKCIFISPHPDDAVLSCAALLNKLSGKTEVTIVTLFTKAHSGPYTLSAKNFLHASDEKNADKLVEKRIKEDRAVLGKLAVKSIYLDLQDALFRLKPKKNLAGFFIPEFNHVYPTYRWHIIKKISSNDPAESQLLKLLKPILRKGSVIFAPYGIGGHVDHQIARKVSEKLSSDVILYSDFPYNSRENFYGEPSKKQTIVTLTPNGIKNKLIKQYSSQFQGLFPYGKIPTHKEVYFLKNTI